MSRFSSSRRSFLKKSAIIFATYPLAASANNMVLPLYLAPLEAAKINWLALPASNAFAGATCGVYWPKGKVNRKSDFQATDDQDQPHPVQSWPMAYWPDGSLKWTGHAFNSEIGFSKSLFIKPGKSKSLAHSLTVSDQPGEITIDTGIIRCVLAKNGSLLIRSISRKEKEISKNGKLILLLQDQPDNEGNQIIKKETFIGNISEVKIEQRGPLRAVIKVSGSHSHTESGNTLIPFVVRMYFYQNSDSIRLIHTIIYDGEENKHFIKGVGLSFDVPLNDELHNRHVRFVNSESQGIFSEAVRGLTGLRRDPGKEITDAQINGKATPPLSAFPKTVSERIHYIPAFGDYTLFQGSSGSFSIRKRTGEQYGWVTSAHGKRASGTAYLGTPSGGLVAGIGNFWQSYPGQIDIRKANENIGTIYLWLWAPDSPAMDLRFYHDGMGQDTFEKQLEGLEITYEDYEPGFGTPKGVARTSELRIWAVNSTPSKTELLEMAEILQAPPTLVCDNKYLEKLKVFGGNWKTEDWSIPAKAAIEEQLDYYFDYYKKQVDQHDWYGFWNYGDFMHSYDTARHTWKYDVGGFAWDNSELSTDLWLWYYFLHTGRSDVFHIAEAMTRHTGEVDVHHLGPFAPLGSRHNVMHWGCSAKQLRISTATNRRFYYYLTTDERVGDLLDEQIEGSKALAMIQPTRKLPGAKPISENTGQKSAVFASFGTDWGSIAGAWLTAWERTEDPRIKKKLINSMQTIASQPRGFFTGGGMLDLETGKFERSKETDPTASHLSAVFGLTEICEELTYLISDANFNKAWIQYCRLYNGTEEEQQKELGKPLKKLNLKQGHSRLTAFAANFTKDAQLAKRAWEEFYEGQAGIKPGDTKITLVKGPDVLNPLEEDPNVSTNGVAQFGLAALQCLAFVGEYISKE